MIQLIYYILFGVVLIYSLYFFITGLFAFKKDNNKISEYKSSTKFAILIPARNEGLVIGDLIDSLKFQEYPDDLYDIYVFVNNSFDNTLDVAIKHGARVINVDVPIKTKGDVLKYAFDKLKDDAYNAYIIFDADNVVHPMFLKRMNDIYNNGYKVAQGRKDSKNIDENWISASYSIFYYLQNFFFNKSRMKINAAAAINGTGFMVDKSVVVNFNPKTLTEDIELSIMCVLNGIDIAYVEDAITYDEQPTSFIDSWNQRTRWSKGIMDCNRLYRKDLFNKFIKDKDFSSIDKILFTAAPFIQNLSITLTIVLSIFKLIGITLEDTFSYIFSLGMVLFILGYLFDIFINTCVVLYYRRSLKGIVNGRLLKKS